MSASSTGNTDVLIVGAGPTGLVLALWLTRMGVRVRIIEKTAEPGTTSRAVAVQARTLEFYRQTGLADAVVERGRQAVAARLKNGGAEAVTSASPAEFQKYVAAETERWAKIAKEAGATPD